MKNSNDKVATIFANLMIERIESLTTESWEKPWFSNEKRNAFYPKNIRGNIYKGGNAFLLTLFALAKGYETPIFMTFKQAQQKNIRINKGEKSLPVYYKNFSITKKDNPKIKITLEQYNNLSDGEKELYNLAYYVRMFLVFNLDQTNFAEVSPEEWESLKNFHNPINEDIQVSENSFSLPIIDEMLNKKSWVCDIELKQINRAFFAPSADKITMPFKESFFKQEQFYTTLIHEMTHSTGTEKRLNRNLKNHFGSDAYAIEELIAEFTSAFTSFKLNIFSEPNKENALYLKSWLKVLKETPKYIFNILDNVVKASDYILNHIGFEMVEELENVELFEEVE